jgi:hypothetical protein
MATLILFARYAAAQPEEKEGLQQGGLAQEVTINITNNINSYFTDVRVKIDDSDNWIELGLIYAGSNVYKVFGVLSDKPGILQARESTGQWVTTVMNKLKPDQIVLEIDNDIHGSNGMAAGRSRDAPAVVSSRVSGDANRTDSLTPIDKRYNYGWFAECKGGGLAFYILSCEIGSTPSMTFTGEGAGFGVVVSQGVWSSDVPRNELVGTAGTFRLEALGYTSIVFPRSHFQGGGAAQGIAGGNGRVGGVRP